MAGEPVGVKAGSSSSLKEIKVKVKVKMDRPPKRHPSGRKSSRR